MVGKSVFHVELQINVATRSDLTRSESSKMIFPQTPPGQLTTLPQTPYSLFPSILDSLNHAHPWKPPL